MADREEEEIEDEEMFMMMLVMRSRRRRREQGRKKRKKRFWVRGIFEERKNYGEYHRLFQELRLGDREYFFR